MDVGKILNSREEETIQVNYMGFTGSAPEGKSKGYYEAKPFLSNIDDEIQKLRELAEKIDNLEINEFNDLEKVEDLTKGLGSSARIALESAILHSKQHWLNW